IERKDLPHGPEAVVRTFKGDPETLSWPIANRQRNPSDGYGQDGQGCLRLLFVRGNAELLQDVTLARRPADARSDLEQYFYGVNQYGEVMMTENQLLTAVEARLKTPATPQVALRQGQPKYFWPGTFLLDDGGRTYHFLVPMDQNRRDYYLEKLRTGDA